MRYPVRHAVPLLDESRIATVISCTSRAHGVDGSNGGYSDTLVTPRPVHMFFFFEPTACPVQHGLPDHGPCQDWAQAKGEEEQCGGLQHVIGPHSTRGLFDKVPLWLWLLLHYVAELRTDDRNCYVIHGLCLLYPSRS